MAYKKVGGSGGGSSSECMILCLEPEGTVVEGIYKGFKEVPGFEGKGTQRKHTFKQSNGKQFPVIGFGLMDHILQNVKEGSRTRVTYLGKDGDYHKCTVEVDDEFKADVNEEDIPF